MANAQNIEIKQTAGRQQLGEFAPEFARLNDDVLFGEVWNRNDKLSLRDRSIVTVVALMSQGLTDSSFQFHLQSAKNNGVTKEEIVEILTHAAFYAGWPKAWAAFRMAKEVWVGDVDDTAAKMTKDVYGQSIIFPIGAPNDAYAKYFVGQSYLASVCTDGLVISNVTFEPGCRNNWHIHHAKKGASQNKTVRDGASQNKTLSEGGGQMLICVGGRGYYQIEGEEAVEMKPGDVKYIPAGVKHWHGAAPNSWFSHLAFEVPGENCSNEWLESVNADDYNKLK